MFHRRNKIDNPTFNDCCKALFKKKKSTRISVYG